MRPSTTHTVGLAGSKPACCSLHAIDNHQLDLHLLPCPPTGPGGRQTCSVMHPAAATHLCGQSGCDRSATTIAQDAGFRAKLPAGLQWASRAAG